MDVSDPASVRGGFAEALGKLGGRMDILVNNAGISGRAPFREADAADFDRVLNTNLRGAYLLSSLAARHMIERKIEGNILNVCSSSSLRPAISPYTLSKWGLRGLTLGLAKTLIPHGIVVNGLAPGPTHTPMLVADGYDGLELSSNPAGRYASAAEIANLAVVLVSALGRMVVGDVLYATGGAGTVTFDDMQYTF